jgi:hypothetical protein
MTDKEQNKSEVEQAPTPKDGSTGMNLRGKDRRPPAVYQTCDYCSAVHSDSDQPARVGL